MPFAAIAIGLVAIAVAASAQVTLSGQVDSVSKEVATQSGKVNDIIAKVAPKTQKFTIIMGEGEIIQEVAGEEELTGEFHRWEPDTLIVKKGDKVELTVKNPRSHAHSFALPAFGVDTGRIAGRVEQPDEAKRTVTVTFTADKAGVFQYICGVPFDHKAGNCDPDHRRMVGYLIVLEG